MQTSSCPVLCSPGALGLKEVGNTLTWLQKWGAWGESLPRAAPLALGAGRKGTGFSYCSSVMGLIKLFNHCLLHTHNGTLRVKVQREPAPGKAIIGHFNLFLN